MHSVVKSRTIFKQSRGVIVQPKWEGMNDTEGCDWIFDMAEKSTMTWKAHRSKKYIFMQEGCKVEVKQDSAKQTTFLELDIGEHPSRVKRYFSFLILSYI